MRRVQATAPMGGESKPLKLAIPDLHRLESVWSVLASGKWKNAFSRDSKYSARGRASTPSRVSRH
jgi:hypothetical protein